MHDERLILLLSDPSLPASFVADVRQIYQENGWPEATHGEDQDFACAVDTDNLVATMTHSCSKCGRMPIGMAMHPPPEVHQVCTSNSAGNSPGTRSR